MVGNSFSIVLVSGYALLLVSMSLTYTLGLA